MEEYGAIQYQTQVSLRASTLERDLALERKAKSKSVRPNQKTESGPSMMTMGMILWGITFLHYQSRYSRPSRRR